MLSSDRLVAVWPNTYLYPKSLQLLKPSLSKKILVVAESIDVEDSSGSKANVALIKNLKTAGFEVLVYHYTRKEISLGFVPCIAIKENRKSPLFYLSRLQRKLQHTFNWNLAKYLEPRFGFSFTFFNDSKSIARALKKQINFQPDLVLTLSKGASFRPHHALLALPELHNKWLAYIHDPYPFHYYPEPYNWSEPGYQKKIEFFKEVASKCKWAGYPSLLLAEWMEDHFSGLKAKRLVIPHQLTKENELPIALPSWFNPEKFNLLHAGNLMKQRPPFGLIRGFMRFLERNPIAQENSRLVLLGNSSYHRERLKKYEGQERQLYISDGYMKYKQVLEMQMKASANIILESKAASSPFLPGKFPHCISAGKPILLLGPEKSETRRLLGQDYPFWSEIEDVERISTLIENLYNQWLNESHTLQMRRNDLRSYLSEDYLKNEIKKLLQ